MIQRSVMLRLMLVLTLWAVEGTLAQTPSLTRFTSRQADLRSDLDRDVVQAIATHIDQTFDGYLGWLYQGKTRPASHRPLIYLFATREGYEAHLTAIGIDGRVSGGLFYATPKETALAIPVTSGIRPQTLSILQHEGFHQFAHAAFASPIPPWLNEGLAEYFEDALVRRGQFTTGLVPAWKVDHLRQAAAQGKLISLEQLLALDQATWISVLQRGGGAGTTLYVQAWSLVHFLQHGDGEVTARGFRRLMEELYAGKAYDEALLLAFGRGGLAQFEPRWRAYMESGLQPDAFSTTRDRVLFIGAGIRWLYEHDPRSVPNSLGALGRILRDSQFTLTSSSHGIEVVRRADDPRFFPSVDDSRQQPRPARLELVPSGSDLPPSISAVGVWPRIRLVWERDRSGRLIERLVYD